MTGFTFFEKIGGFTVAIIFLARLFIGIFDRPMLEADLIKSFYQIEPQEGKNKRNKNHVSVNHRDESYSES